MGATFYVEPMPQAVDESWLIERIGEICDEWPSAMEVMSATWGGWDRLG